MIEVRNLAFAYGRRQVLRDVSFVASPGEVVSVVGDNGAGKTTLLRILATLAVPDAGMVLTDGQDAFARPLKYRRQLGYLPEKVALYEDMTVKEYLHYRARLKGEPSRRVRRRVGEATELCQISPLLRCPIRILSAGQAKRVALADAILLRPRVLLLDDFLAGLDRGVRQAMGTILSDAASFSSVIVTGHELEDFAGWSTRFLVLRNGVVSASVVTAGLDRATLLDRLSELMKGEA
ncbi:MAG: ATP-binding cassette domain-containing protein [Kiritimatiellia bacterium]